MPVRTFGGAGGASTSTGVAPGSVVWGPNFGSTRELAEEGTMFSSLTLGTTQTLLGEELLRPWQYDASYPTVLRHEETFSTFSQSLGVNSTLIEEEAIVPTSFEATYRPVIEEGELRGAAIPTFQSTGEMVLRLLSQSPQYLNTQESLVRIAREQFEFTPMGEEGDVAAIAQFFFSSSRVWTVPTGTTVATLEVWGGGGGGGQGGALNGGGGGGGGGYSLATGVSVTPGATVTVTVGGGSTQAGIKSWILSSATGVLARGGGRGGDNAGGGGLGGTTATAVGTVLRQGGAGANNSGGGGGGGGGGAGTLSSGGTASSTAGANGGSFGGGRGGDGGNSAQAGDAAAAFGGGGGGGGAVSAQGGAGARGLATITITLPT